MVPFEVDLVLSERIFKLLNSNELAGSVKYGREMDAEGAKGQRFAERRKRKNKQSLLFFSANLCPFSANLRVKILFSPLMPQSSKIPA